MALGRAATASVLALACMVAGGCGSSSVRELPPAAEPRDSPPLTQAPTGRVTKLGPRISALTAGRTMPPGGAPEGMAFDERTGILAVGLRRPAQLALIDCETGRVRHRVDLNAGPRHLAVDPGRDAFVVPNEMASTLSVIAAQTGRVLTDVRTGAYPHAVAVAGPRILVGDERGNTLTVVNGDRIVATKPVAVQPGGVVPVLDDTAAAVVSVRERVVELYSLPGLERVARVPAGVGPTHAVALGNLLWVADTQGDALLVFRLLPKLKLVRRVNLPGGPYGMALDPARKRLWITLTATNEIVELPAHGRPHVLRTFPVVRQPNTVAIDSRTGRVFVGGRSDGVLETFVPRATAK